MKSKGLPGKFWGEAVNTAVYLLNMESTESGVGITPYEAWYGWKPSVDHLRTFGCVAHVKAELAEQRIPMIMTGYEGSKTYRLCNPYTNKVVFKGDVIFEEGKSWNWGYNEPEYSTFHVTWDLEYEENMDQSSLSLSASLGPEDIEGLGAAPSVDTRPEALGILPEDKEFEEKASLWPEDTELEGCTDACAAIPALVCPKIRGGGGAEVSPANRPARPEGDGPRVWTGGQIDGGDPTIGGADPSKGFSRGIEKLEENKFELPPTYLFYCIQEHRQVVDQICEASMRKYFIEPSIMSQGADKKDSRREGMEKGADKKGCRREVMEKSTKAKSVT